MAALVAAALAATFFFSVVFAEDAFLAGAADFAAGFLVGTPAVVFFGAAFFGAAAVAAFLVAAGVAFCEAGFFALDAVVGFFAAVFLAGASAFLTGAGAFFAAGFTAAFFTGIGFEFSSSDAFFLGASLTFPEGPLGKAKIPAVTPDVIARLS